MSAQDPKFDNTQQEELYKALFDLDKDELNSSKIDEIITAHSEIQKHYDEQQELLQFLIAAKAKPCDPKVLEQSLKAVKKHQPQNFGKIIQYVAASVAVLLGILSVQLYQSNLQLKAEQVLVQSQIVNLEEDVNVQLEDLRNQYIVLNSPHTIKKTIIGNSRAKQLKAIAYINPIKKLSYINVQNLPKLTQDKCYQIWTEVNGGLVSLGVIKNLEDPEKMLRMPFAENALSFITIENDGGNFTPNLIDQVAKISYQNIIEADKVSL
ncbi:MAG: anti-sigma factor [Flavobacteriaceae bacterium]|nr:anti-sigma factor [Flavobacteriaceae bacterium]